MAREAGFPWRNSLKEISQMSCHSRIRAFYSSFCFSAQSKKLLSNTTLADVIRPQRLIALARRSGPHDWTNTLLGNCMRHVGVFPPPTSAGAHSDLLRNGAPQ